jgi:CubicO group peptidase (beta-lactamase class C family)
MRIKALIFTLSIFLGKGVSEIAWCQALTKKEQKAITKIKSIANEMLEKTKVPGMAMAIVKDGRVILSEGFGYRDKENKLPVTPSTLFAIGSVSKSFTAMTLAQLEDDDVIQWNDPVRKHLPRFKLKDPVANEFINVRDLLTHCSGLARHDFSWIGATVSREELIDRIPYLEPNKEFRTTWQYQNLLYVTAGYLAGQVSGKTWEQLALEKILKPLGMTHTNFSITETVKQKDYAHPYYEDESKNMVKTELDNYDVIAPAGSINSNLLDMVKWVGLHLGDTTLENRSIVSNDNLELMHSPLQLVSTESSQPELTPPAYGLGWFVYHHNGHKVVQHGGNVTGFTALVYLLPKDKVGMVFLTNGNTNKLPSIMSLYASDLLLGFEPQNWYERAYGKLEADDKKEKEKQNEKEAKRKTGTKPHHNLKEYAGEYNHPGYGDLTVKIENDTTLEALYNGYLYPLKHWHYEVFQGTHKTHQINWFFNFQTDNDGAVVAVNIPFERSMDTDISFHKLPPNNLKEHHFLTKLVGNYEAEGLPMKIEFKTDDAIQVTPKGQGTYELVPYKGTEFKFKGANGYSIEFVWDGQAEKVGEAKLHQPNGTFKLIRIK